MNKGFRLSSIATGNIKSRKRQYVPLGIGITLAIFFTATIFLLASTFIVSIQERRVQQYGAQDVVLFNCAEQTANDLLDNKMLTRAEKIEIVAQVLPDGSTNGNAFSLARMSASAAEFAGKKLKEGKMPSGEGEIALEWNALSKLKSRAEVGDTIEVVVRTPDGQGGYLADTVTKQYRLTGILEDQYPFLVNAWATDVGTLYPTGIVTEDVEPGGKSICNIYGELAAKDEAGRAAMLSYCDQNGVARDLNASIWGSESIQSEVIIFVFLAIVCVILITVSCLWIVDAFASNLNGRKQQIGLLRAVGATRKQIRSIFSRETLIIAVITVPLALALSCLAVFMITQIIGGYIVFRINVVVLVVAAAAGIAVVFLSSLFLLRKAARISPMQAIRNMDISRAMKKVRLKPHKGASMATLLAKRNLTLYKAKQVRITAVLAISIVLFSIVSFVAAPLIAKGTAVYSSEYGDYTVRLDQYMHDGIVAHRYLEPGITDSDRMEILALPTVKYVSGEKIFMLKILLDEITPYVANSASDVSEALPEYYDPFTETAMPNQNYEKYLQARQKYGYDKEFFNVQCCGVDDSAIMALADYVSEGEIDIAKLSAGEEILVIAPTEYGIVSLGPGSSRTDYKLLEDENYLFTGHNDTFHAGDEITLSLLYADAASLALEDLPDDAVRLDKTVRIGAIIDPSLAQEDKANDRLLDFMYFGSQTGELLTTVTGLGAMGYNVPYSALKITLTQSPDRELEMYLDEELARIAVRADNFTVTSAIALQRENRQSVFGSLFIAYVLIVLFLGICISMVNNVITARIRADKRQIGTIRAVGGSAHDILSSYRLQILAMLAIGAVIGLVVGLAICVYLSANAVVSGATLPIWQSLVFIAVIASVCWINIRHKLKKILSNSIVENIREL